MPGDTQCSNGSRDYQSGKEELVCRNTGIFFVAASNVLRGNNGAASSESREYGNDQNVDGISQGNTGYGGFACACDHDYAHHADEYGKKLLNDQRNYQFGEILFCKHTVTLFLVT